MWDAIPGQCGGLPLGGAGGYPPKYSASSTKEQGGPPGWHGGPGQQEQLPAMGTGSHHIRPAVVDGNGRQQRDTVWKSHREGHPPVEEDSRRCSGQTPSGLHLM